MAIGDLKAENYLPVVRNNQGYYSNYPIQTTSTITSATNNPFNAPVTTHTPVAINSTATATGAQVASGYITSTSGVATTITLPSAGTIATAIGATQGTVFDLYVDNTAGANTVTVAKGSNITSSDVAAVATYGVPTFGLLTVSASAAGIARFTLVFSSATACTITRTA